MDQEEKRLRAEEAMKLAAKRKADVRDAQIVGCRGPFSFFCCWAVWFSREVPLFQGNLGW